MGDLAHAHDDDPALGEDADEGAGLDPQLVVVMHQAEALVETMQSFFKRLDRTLYSEFRMIASFIAKARDEIGNLRPNDLSKDRIPSAGAELEAIVRDTEAATFQIMNCAEAILSADNSDPAAYKELVDGHVMTIFEACSFQDITGQRVSKVVNVLRQVETRVARLAEQLGVSDKEEELSADDQRKKDLLLNGPALNGPEVGQDSIDALFGPGPASQDDIDSLFD